MGEHLLRQLRERLHTLQSMSIMSLATLLDPRFKLIGFFSPSKAAEATKRLVAECGALIRTPEDVQPEENPSTSQPEQEIPGNFINFKSIWSNYYNIHWHSLCILFRKQTLAKIGSDCKAVQKDQESNSWRNCWSPAVPGWTKYRTLGGPSELLADTKTCVSKLIYTCCHFLVHTCFLSPVWKGIFKGRRSCVQEKKSPKPEKCGKNIVFKQKPIKLFHVSQAFSLASASYTSIFTALWQVKPLFFSSFRTYIASFVFIEGSRHLHLFMYRCNNKILYWHIVFIIIYSHFKTLTGVKFCSYRMTNTFDIFYLFVSLFPVFLVCQRLQIICGCFTPVHQQGVLWAHEAHDEASWDEPFSEPICWKASKLHEASSRHH